MLCVYVYVVWLEDRFLYLQVLIVFKGVYSYVIYRKQDKYILINQFITT